MDHNDRTNDHILAVGAFLRSADARAAIAALRDAGFADDRLGIVVRDRHGAPELESLETMSGSRAGTGAAMGAAAGAGGGALWAAGIAAGVLPAIGPIVAGGVLVAVAAGLAAGAAAGGLVGTLVGLGISDDEAAHYDEEFRAGKTIVVVSGPGDAEHASRVLDQHHGINSYAAAFLRRNQPRAAAGAR